MYYHLPAFYFSSNSALKHVFDRNLQDFLEKNLIRLLKQLEKSGDTDEVVDVLYYILNENEYLNEKRFWAVFHEEFSEEVEGKMMTIAERMRARAVEEGKLEIAKRLLTETAGRNENDLLDWVQRITGLSIEKNQRSEYHRDND